MPSSAFLKPYKGSAKIRIAPSQQSDFLKLMPTQMPRYFASILFISLSSLLTTGYANDSDERLPESYLPESFFPELATIIQRALKDAPILEEQTLQIDEANARLDQTRSRGLPSVNFFLQSGPREEFRSGNNSNNSYYAWNGLLRATQPLYHWGAIKAEIERARLAVDDSELDRLSRETELIRNLRADYLGILLNRQQRIKEESRLSLVEAEVSRLKIEFESGKLPEMNLRGKQIQAEKVRLSISRIRAYERVLRDRFREKYAYSEEIKAIEPLPSIDIAAAGHWLEYEKTTINGSRVNEYISIQRQLGLVKQQEEYLKMVEKNNLPKFNLFVAGNQGLTNTASENDVNTVSVTAGISVNWNIFDGFRTREQSIEARLKKNRLEYGLNRKMTELQSEQSRMLESLDLRLQELDLQEQSFEIQKAMHRTTEISLEEGRITKANYQSAQLLLDNLEIGRNQALVAVLQGFSDYDSFTRLVGEN